MRRRLRGLLHGPGRDLHPSSGGAYDIAARMQYAGSTLDAASHAVVFAILSSHAIGAGLVATHKELHPMGPA